MHKDKVSHFEEIFHQTSGQLYGFINGMVRNHNLVQDFMQQCYLKLWERFDETDLEKEVLPLLYTYARNLVIDHLRKQTREQLVGDYAVLENEATAQNSVQDYITEKEHEKGLHDAINKMPARRKEVFSLIKIQGMSYQEVSLQLGISVSTVEKHMHEAYKFLAAWSSALFICCLLVDRSSLPQ